MDGNLIEWLHLLLRWMHVLAAISWIGSSFYFMWLDQHISPKLKSDKNAIGGLWMVHSGGFYRVEKRYLAADQMPEKLHWFKWEALFTWITGFSLLILVYFFGGILIDPTTSPISENTAIALAIGLLVFSWALYDQLWVSPLGKNIPLATVLSYLLVVCLIYFLSKVFSGRATFIQTGATLGTLMVANVWMRILPAQRQMIAATQSGKERDLKLAERAKMRSVHNNYMTFPVVFIMISSHFPSTYGSEWNWLILSVLILLSAGVRHYMNLRSRLE